MTKQTAHLENWIKIEGWNTFSGIVTGHPKLEDGTQVITSKVVTQDLEAKTVETRNTFYTLGEPYVVPDPTDA